MHVDAEELDEGARLRIRKMDLMDFGTLANSLFTHATPPVPSEASLDLRWMGNTGPTNVTDPGANRFAIHGIFTHATLAWSARVPSQNFEFHSDAASTSHETFAELVSERNGSFFDTEQDDD